MNVTLKNGKQGKVTIDKGTQTARVVVDGVSYLICYIRNNKVKVKNDNILGETDLAHVREQMKQFVKVVDNGKKGKGSRK